MAAQNPNGPVPTDQTLALLFLKIDANGNGSIDWDEFTSHVLLKSVPWTLLLRRMRHF